MALSELEITSNDRLLIISPHPDDECIGCGGLIAAFPKQCEIIVLTDGSRAGSLFPDEEMAKKRAEEFKNEMEAAGVDRWKMKGYINSELIFEPDCCESIDFSAYTKVFIPMRDDNHFEHVSTYVYAMREIRKQNYKGLVYQYEVQEPMENAAFYFDLSDHIDKKQHLIQKHKSQLEILDYIGIIRDRDRNHKIKFNLSCDYSEVFKEAYFSETSIDDRMIDLLIKEKKLSVVENIMNIWTKNRMEGKDLCDYLLSNDITSISIYGFSYLGQILYQDLHAKSYDVKYILDRGTNINHPADLPVFKPDRYAGEVDLVIVTVLSKTEQIKKYLYGLGYSVVISLYELMINYNLNKKIGMQ